MTASIAGESKWLAGMPATRGTARRAAVDYGGSVVANLG